MRTLDELNGGFQRLAPRERGEVLVSFAHKLTIFARCAPVERPRRAMDAFAVLNELVHHALAYAMDLLAGNDFDYNLPAQLGDLHEAPRGAIAQWFAMAMELHEQRKAASEPVIAVGNVVAQGAVS